MPPILSLDHGSVFWESPAIQIWDPTPTPTSPSGGYLPTLQVYQLKRNVTYGARVFVSNTAPTTPNQANSATSVRVALYMSNPTSIGYLPNAASLSPAPILIDIPEQSVRYVDFSFDPKVIDTLGGMPQNSSQSNYHTCLFAQADNDADPYQPNQGHWDGTDRHVAQHNTDVLANPAQSARPGGSPFGRPVAQNLVVGFQVHHGAEQAVDTVIRFEKIAADAPILARVGATLGREHRINFTAARSLREDHMGLQLRPERIQMALDRVSHVPHAPQLGPRGVLAGPLRLPVLPRASRFPQLDPTKRPAKLEQRLTFRQTEPELREGAVWLAAQPDMHPGELYGVRVIQEDAHGHRRGGLTIVVYQGLH